LILSLLLLIGVSQQDAEDFDSQPGVAQLVGVCKPEYDITDLDSSLDESLPWRFSPAVIAVLRFRKTEIVA